ncbi:MAG: hypothetical protein GY796_02155 [Chloroflexi bacterium]|nr:hypothetical protein [Chloroflexota bacterium]
MKEVLEKIIFPETAFCTVWEFVQSHNHMDIHVTNFGEEKPFLLRFHGVEFYSGPLIWNASSIDLGSEGDRNELMANSLWAYDGNLDNLYLFKIGAPELVVKIIARDLKVEEGLMGSA